MKVAQVVLLFATFLFSTLLFSTLASAQDQSSIAAVEAACGPKDVQFETQTAPSQSNPQPEAGKSLVYVVEVFAKVVGEIARPTLRVGVDGKWVGADKGNSYISFSVEPGEHHLCANWQSHWKRLSNEMAFNGFTADPGKIYYFRARINEIGGSGGASNFSLDLEPLNQDEGKYLVGSSALSASQPKK
ncbi:MAG: hypothetical protein ACLPHP_04360 [Candidatus Sulfotelmatobacter sp.]